MKLKKYLGIILAATMALSVVGCGKEKEREPDPYAITDENYDDHMREIQQKALEKMQKYANGRNVQCILINDDKLMFKLMEVKTGMLGAELHLEIHNKTNQDITLQMRDTSVNGYMQYVTFSETITAGNKSNARMIFSGMNDINQLRNIEGELIMFNASTWNDIAAYKVKMLGM